MATKALGRGLHQDADVGALAHADPDQATDHVVDAAIPAS